MGRINVLSFAVANLIAAGEVVDRPASVIKELLENAIDSGADRITVEIQNGGVTYMRVADNGCGMEPDELPVSIRRHATSKIKDAADLEKILTLGFRGEALAAIASVSDLRIISKTRNAEVGAMLEAHAGNIYGVTERACSDGTTVIVENLFANVPARRKFLKKDVTESMAVSALVEKIALSKPNIAFRLISDGNIRLETVGDGNLKNTIYSVFGKEFATRLIDTRLTLDGIEVYGFVGRSDNVRANRNYQNFFINGRYVKSKTAMSALEQAYTSYIPPEKFPCCVLFLTIHPAAVDVNVHPAKLEVKFSNEKPVFEAVYYAVRNALEANSERPSVSLKPAGRSDRLEARLSDATRPIEDGKGESLQKRQLSETLTTAPKETPVHGKGGFAHMSTEEFLAEYLKRIPKDPIPRTAGEESKQENKQESKQEKPQEPSRAEQPAVQDAVIAPLPPTPSAPAAATVGVTASPAEAPVEEAPPAVPLSYRILGEAFHSYVFVECGDKVLVIDKHAAHERILFESLRAGMREADKVSQLLMIPLEIMMTSEEIQALTDYRTEIEAVGFAFTTGRYTVSVSEVPQGIAGAAVADVMTVIAERLRSNTGSAKLTRDIVFEKALYQASCKAAIKAGREYTEGHIEWLVEKLMALPDITVCPHGRPVAMELSKKQLDHQFERT